jgi:hypothetical protein
MRRSPPAPDALWIAPGVRRRSTKRSRHLTSDREIVSDKRDRSPQMRGVAGKEVCVIVSAPAQPRRAPSVHTGGDRGQVESSATLKAGTVTRPA